MPAVILLPLPPLQPQLPSCPCSCSCLPVPAQLNFLLITTPNLLLLLCVVHLVARLQSTYLEECAAFKFKIPGSDVSKVTIPGHSLRVYPVETSSSQTLTYFIIQSLHHLSFLLCLVADRGSTQPSRSGLAFVQNLISTFVLSEKL